MIYNKNNELNTQCNRFSPIDSYSLTIPTNKQNKIIIDNKIRFNTPKECWRLMGFKDDEINKAFLLGYKDTTIQNGDTDIFYKFWNRSYKC